MAEHHDVPKLLVMARDLVHKVQILIENKWTTSLSFCLQLSSKRRSVSVFGHYGKTKPSATVNAKPVFSSAQILIL